jgi:phosphatidylglycerophosphatase A
MGEILKRLQAAWIRAGFPSDPASLSRLLDDAIAGLYAAALLLAAIRVF